MKSSEEKLGPSRAEILGVEREEGCPPHRSVERCSILVGGTLTEVLRYGGEVESLSGARDQVDAAHRRSRHRLVSVTG